MGLLKGSATLSRYSAHPPVREGLADFLDERIRAFAFQDIEDTADDLGLGWVSVHDFLDTQFAYAEYALEPYLVLGLRIDQRRVTAALVNKYFRLMLERHKEKYQGRKLGRAQREELKERVRLELLRRMPTTTQLIEVVWELAKGELLVGTATKSTLDLFEDFFRRSFDVQPVAHIPYLMANRILEERGEAQTLEELRPWGLG